MSKQEMSKQTQPKSKDMQGEGNYTAAKEYDDATTNFAKSGKVDQAARAANPKNAQEEQEMMEAEAKGRARAKPEGSQRNKSTR